MHFLLSKSSLKQLIFSTQINEHQPIGDIEKNGIERASQVFCSNLQYKGRTGEILLLKVFIDMKARINQSVLVF